MWNNEHVLNLVSQNHQVILPLVYPALERNARNHWNQAVLNLTLNVKKIFYEMDEELVLACQCKLEEEDLKLSAAAEKRRLTWERLESSSSLQPPAGHILVPPKAATTCSVAC